MQKVMTLLLLSRLCSLMFSTTEITEQNEVKMSLMLLSLCRAWNVFNSVLMYCCELCLEYDGKEILNAKQFVLYAMVAFMDDVRRS